MTDVSIQDLRLAARRWRRRPGVSLTAVAVLSLGIGTTTAIFSALAAVLLRPLPWADPGSLVVIHAVNNERRESPAYVDTWDRQPISIGGWNALRQSPAFVDVAGWMQTSHVRLVEHEIGRVLTVHRGTSNLLHVLGVYPAAGRFFTTSEDSTPNDSLLISFELWHERFGGDPAIVGSRLLIAPVVPSDQLAGYEVVGVLPPQMALGGVPTDLLRSIGTGASVRRLHSTPILRLIGRLPLDGRIGAARASADAILPGTEAIEATAARVAALSDDERGDSLSPLWVLLAGAVMLLTISGANVAGLMLIDAHGRGPEMAIRAALGGRLRHVLRQVAAEQLLLSATAVATGLVTAYWLVRVTGATIPPGLRSTEIPLGGGVTMFAVAAGFVTVALFGTVPVIWFLRGIGQQQFRTAGSTPVSRANTRSQKILVASHLALTSTLLLTAVLLARTLFDLKAAPLGLEPEGVLIVAGTSAGSARPAMDRSAFAELARRSSEPSAAIVGLLAAPARARTRHVLTELRRLPGVAEAAASNFPPFGASPGFVRVQLESTVDAVDLPAQVLAVTDSYFGTLNIPILAGRSFSDIDRRSDDAVIVSREFARRYLGDSAVGRGFYFVVGPEGQEARLARRVIGVVGDVRQRSPLHQAGPVYYEPYGGDLGNMQYYSLRAGSDADRTAAEIRSRFAAIDPGFLVTDVRTLTTVVEEATAEERFRGHLSIAFAIAALLMSALGVHGLAARRVRDRRVEFGVRLALGASAPALRRLIVNDVLATVGAGLAVGTAVSLGSASLLRAIAFGVSNPTPDVLAGTAALLGLVSIGSVFVAIAQIPADRLRLSDE